MNILLRCWLVAVLVATSGWASDEKKTDAQRYGLAGAVRTVSTQEGKAEFSLDQRDWPVLVGMVECKECEFDRDGALTLNGQIAEGGFQGERYHTTRDERGNIVEQVRLAANDEIAGRTVYGPYGIIEASEYTDGVRGFHSEW